MLHSAGLHARPCLYEIPLPPWLLMALCLYSAEQRTCGPRTAGMLLPTERCLHRATTTVCRPKLPCSVQGAQRTVTVDREAWAAACRDGLKRQTFLMAARHQLTSARHHMFTNSQVGAGTQ